VNFLAELINLKSVSDSRGALTVIDSVLPFEIKRVFYLYSVKGTRGEHRHKKTWQALISVVGKCSVFVDNGSKKELFVLDSPEKCLILAPQDWHRMEKFSKGAVLLCLASTNYDKEDYVSEGYS
jgi:hypothetical protein